MLNLPPAAELPPSPRAVTRGKFFLYGLVLIVAGTVLMLARQPHVQATIIEWNQHTLWENVRRLVGANDVVLRGEAQGRINILLLGQGGSRHEGPYLTDTIMIASVQPQPLRVSLLSIPRDLVVPMQNFGTRRINTANAFGEQRTPGQGAVFASQVVAETFGLPIHYYVRLDFSGFAKIIDQLGGLPINIEQGFTDREYPTETNGFTEVTFEPGWQTLNGERTLQYVRSRHGSGGEGSDFARARRQQQVLIAIKQKILSPATFFNPSLALKFYSTLNKSLETNLGPSEAVRIAHVLRKADPNAVVSRVLDTSPRGLLKESISADGAYLLVPASGDYATLKRAAAELLQINRVAEEQARVIVENGTTSAGLAEAAADGITSQGFTVVSFGNATHRDFPRTLIYDYSGGTKPFSRQVLESTFQAAAISLERSAETNIDFRVVMGADRLTP